MTSHSKLDRGVSADKITSLPSLSCSLSSLPQAKTMANVSLHPTMYAQRAAESEAKLQKVLSKTASSYSPQNPPSVPSYMNPPPRNSHSPSCSSSPLMMRKPQKLQVWLHIDLSICLIISGLCWFHHGIACESGHTQNSPTRIFAFIRYRIACILRRPKPHPHFFTLPLHSEVKPGAYLSFRRRTITFGNYCCRKSKCNIAFAIIYSIISCYKYVNPLLILILHWWWVS